MPTSSSRFLQAFARPLSFLLLNLTVILTSMFLLTRTLFSWYQKQMLGLLGAASSADAESVMIRVFLDGASAADISAGEQVLLLHGMSGSALLYLREQFPSRAFLLAAAALLVPTVIFFLCHTAERLHRDKIMTRLLCIGLALRRQAARDEKKADAMNRLLENISHQIKTPAACALLCLDLIAMDDTLEEKEQHRLECVRQLSRVQEIIASLLRLAQFRSGQMPVRLERQSISGILDRVSPSLKPFFSEKHQTYSVTGDTDCEVLCDRFWIREALINVLKNASEHAPENGSVTLAVVRRDFGVDIYIRDSGTGVPADAKERIFDRFFQADASEHSGNFGLGLSLAQEIMIRHGGSLDLLADPNMKEGRKSCFRFRLYNLPGKAREATFSFPP